MPDLGDRALDDIAIVDAHQHFWDLEHNTHPWLRDQPRIAFRYGDYGRICRTYLPDRYRADTAGHNVVKTVHVEAEWDPWDPLGETRWLRKIKAAYGVPTAVVAQAWLDRDDVAEVLAAEAEFAEVRGIRHKPAAVPGAMADAKWRAGFALLERFGLSFDLQTPYPYLPEAADLARAFPRTQIIVNHTGLPADRSRRGLAAWRAAMRAAAAAPNLAVKISGLGLPGRRWRVADNRPVVLDTIEAFGVARCMFASNFPVDGLVADFDTIFSGFKDIVHDFPPADRRKLFHDNAVRIYRLEA